MEARKSKAKKNEPKQIENIEMDEESQDESDKDLMTKEVQVCFKTTMPDRYKVPETEITLSTGSSIKDMT